MHIHPSSPNSATNSSLQSEESAAIKIQAGFRGYRVRKQLDHQKSRTSCRHYPTHRSASQRRQYAMEGQDGGSGVQAGTLATGGSGANGLLLVANQRREERGSDSGSSQANSMEDRCATKIQAGVRGFLVRKKQKIAADAATKIQAGFRGFKVRKEAQNLKHK